MSLTPKNWQTFQHYKNRHPVWIKLHRSLLNDFAFTRLPVASRALAPMLWLLASEYDDGNIKGSPEEIAFRVHMAESELTEALNPLIEAGFFIVDSELLALCERSASTEKRRERGETEEISAIAPMFAAFNGTVIRLNAKNFQQWKTAYPQLDLMAELTARDAWLASARATDEDRSNWFVSTAQHFANRNQAARNAPARKLLPDGIL